ncbi:MAG TPA: LptA/OstA family protein [Xanthobacteraceae bacterium]|nr:LptA/OstA family protein [Xanthobacteraceae bacterium]
MMALRNVFAGSVLAVVAVLTPAASLAQTGQAAPNLMEGFTKSRDKPVQIRAQSFEIRDKDKTATFSGNVQVVQGDTIIRCKTLVVTYVAEAGAGLRAAQAGPGGRTQISKLDALGGVIVTQQDQTATGDVGHFDLKTNIITLRGNVVVSQGGNVVRGDQLVVDLNTGISRVESGKQRGQVEMLMIPPAQQGEGKPGAARDLPRIDLLRPKSN